MLVFLPTQDVSLACTQDTTSTLCQVPCLPPHSKHVLTCAMQHAVMPTASDKQQRYSTPVLTIRTKHVSVSNYTQQQLYYQHTVQRSSSRTREYNFQLICTQI